MARRGRPRKSWEDMRRDGAKPSVWQRRRRETEAEPDITAFREAKRKVGSTFKSRCIPGETLCREFNGDKFDWLPGHNLTLTRDLCLSISQDANYRWPETQQLCREFLDTLATGEMRGVRVDPEACKLIDLYFNAYANEDMPLYLLSLFDLVQWVALRRDSGAYVLPDSELAGFETAIVKMMDSASEALRPTA